jgi:hypothetical protein
VTASSSTKENQNESEKVVPAALRLPRGKIWFGFDVKPYQRKQDTETNNTKEPKDDKDDKPDVFSGSGNSLRRK